MVTVRETRDRTRLRAFGRFAARDLVLVSLSAALVAWDRALIASKAGGPAAVAIGVLTGVSFALSSFLLHEWGHWLGAVGSGALVHPPKAITSFFLFFFDTGKSNRRQFLAMSYGGYAATLLALALLLSWARLDTWSGRTALLFAGLGMAITAALEVPTTWKVARGQPIPGGIAFVGPDDSAPSAADTSAS